MLEEEGRITKAQILKKIQVMLEQDIEMDAGVLFSKIQEYLEPEGSSSGCCGHDGIGYVQIEEAKQDEYRQWEKGIRQEWLETIENIRQGLKDSRQG